jgi:hypothetical protein
LAEVATRNLQKENAELKKALEQCRKREGAIQAIFIRNHEKEQELAAKERELENKAHEIEGRFANLELETERTSSECWADLTPAQADQTLKARIKDLQQKLARYLEREDAVQKALNNNHEREQQLAEKEFKMKKKEQHQKNEDAILEIKKDALEEQKRIIDAHIAEQKAVRDLCMNGTSQLNAVTDSGSISDLMSFLEYAQSTIFVCGESGQLFEAEIRSRPWLCDFESAITSIMESHEIELLRRHDYYKGWLDAMKAEDALQAYSRGSTAANDYVDVWNSGDLRSARNAGLNVGLLFTWSALCDLHGKRDKDIRLDGRAWNLSDLHPPFRDSEAHSGFWERVARGSDMATQMFELFQKTGDWKTRYHL